jgi:hypothetical protein
MSDESKKWVVWSNEHRAYWGPNRSGYRRCIETAGRYTHDEARAICFPGRGGGGDWPPPEMMFPDPMPDAPELVSDMHAHFGRQLR